MLSHQILRKRAKGKLPEYVYNVLAAQVIHVYSCILTDIVFSAVACTFSSYTNM